MIMCIQILVLIGLFVFQDIEQKLNSDDDPWGVANLDPRGMIGRIYVEYHLTLLHTKYTTFRPCGFREEDF